MSEHPVDENTTKLIAKARTTIRDADRCVSLGISPAAGTLHRHLREVTDALEAAQPRVVETLVDRHWREHPEAMALAHTELQVEALREQLADALEAAQQRIDAAEAEYPGDEYLDAKPHKGAEVAKRMHTALTPTAWVPVQEGN